jgi:hypothetical protein
LIGGACLYRINAGEQASRDRRTELAPAHSLASGGAPNKTAGRGDLPLRLRRNDQPIRPLPRR